MKKLLALTSLFFSPLLSQAQQWTAMGCNENINTHIAQTAATVSYSAVAADGTHYIAFIDDAGGPNNVTDFRIHVKKYNGTQWINVGGGATPQFPSTDFFPIAVSGNEIYLAYTEPFGSGFDGKVSVKKFNPGNDQWELVGTRGFSTGAAGAVGLTAVGSRIYAGYADDAFFNKVSVKMFDMNNTAAGWQLLGTEGLSDGAAVQLPGSGVQVKTNGNNVYIAYIDISLNTAGGLVMKKFDGSNWTNVGGIVSGNNPGYFADIDFDNTGKIYVGYFEPNAQQAIVRTLEDATWSTVSGQAVATTITGPVSMAVMNNKPYIAYAPAAGIVNAAVKVFNSSNGVWEFAGTNPATNLSGTSDVIDLNLAASGNTLHLNFHTSSSGLYVKTWTSSVLPLQLISFAGALKNNTAVLSWKTINEVNTSVFEVEHKTGLQTFVKTGEVKTQGNTQGEYSFTTASLKTGNHFFRLKIVDKDGSFRYSPVISLTINTKEKVSVYPNPAKDVLQISTENKVYKTVIISDMNGKIISTVSINQPVQAISIASLVPGRYMLALYNTEDRLTLSFIKQ